MAGSVPRTIAVTFDGAPARSDVPGLCASVSAALAEGAAVVVCHLAGASACLVTVDALARLQLVTRRHDAQLELRDTSVELRRLLALTGLLGTLPR